ncbi:ArdC family protein [Ruminococcus sp.]|uniref:ArdC family protein n=1 Tax=Ruminococcus sp. TaxID=41978 RepID=UPI002E78FF0E|nr:zincin-like metallopeptidase domain-containing protein [Ruminococcus sp.]MEE1262051.1 zincin-like metallopeptidase domain-containing protein [Ruminococcus sp.]
MSKLNKMREQIANRFIAALQEERIPWHQEWQNVIAPYNAVTGRGYRGLNYFWLACIAMDKNYADPRWCTFIQAKDKGWKVIKGEKGTRVEFWSMYDTKTKKKLTPSQVKKLRDTLELSEFHDRVKPISNVFTVFNGEQLDGIPKLKVENRRLFSTAELIELRDRLLKNMELRLREGGNEAFYSPTNDYVNMPMIERFDGAYSYMSTFLHESAHASGAKHRLNRDLSGRFGSESYAKEELRAEIASAFTASATGIKYEQSPTMENHAAYIQNWIKVLENNPNELFAAIKDAEKISDYLLEKGELIVKEPPEIADAEVEAAAEPTDENYRYREISYEDFRKLRDAGFDVADNCRQSTKHPDMVILRYTEQQAAEINAVLKPAVGAAIKK